MPGSLVSLLFLPSFGDAVALTASGYEAWVLGWVDVDLEKAGILDGDDVTAALEGELRWARSVLCSSCWWSTSRSLGGDHGGKGQNDDGGEGLHVDVVKKLICLKKSVLVRYCTDYDSFWSETKPGQRIHALYISISWAQAFAVRNNLRMPVVDCILPLEHCY